VIDTICKLAKKGMRPSEIGVNLRDQSGIPQVRSITGSKVLRILKAQGLAPELPEDLYYLIKKAVAMRKHLERFRKDKDAKFHLILIESRIHRLARYYKVCAVVFCVRVSARVHFFSDMRRSFTPPNTLFNPPPPSPHALTTSQPQQQQHNQQ
jgi:ribosomal protein S15P/S13E